MSEITARTGTQMPDFEIALHTTFRLNIAWVDYHGAQRKMLAKVNYRRSRAEHCICRSAVFSDYKPFVMQDPPAPDWDYLLVGICERCDGWSIRFTSTFHPIKQVHQALESMRRDKCIRFQHSRWGQ